MGQALYRKYRSKSLAELVGQEHITTALENALKTGRISHAYLFTGPRGVGKTSVARILAHEINQLPYSDKTHLDIIEIDAASNRRIDDIRDLREKVHIAPVSAQYKVYIIDEVHMLTGESFNALLKTLEEPPAHVIFILATTEIHKLPATIVSRTQRFTFRPVEQPKVIEHLRSIAKQEHILINDEALALVAEHGEGSFRDSISLLDQLAGHGDGEITAQSVEQTLGLAPVKLVSRIVEAILAKDTAALATHLAAMAEAGVTTGALLNQLLKALNVAAAKEPALYALLDELLEVPRAYNPQLKLTTTVMRYALGSAVVAASVIPAVAHEGSNPSRPAMPEHMAKKPVAALATPPAPTLSLSRPAPHKTSNPAAAEPAAEPFVGTQLDVLSAEGWGQVLAAVKAHSVPLHGILGQAEPRFTAATNSLVLAFRYPLHCRKMDDTKNKNTLAKIMQETLGGAPAISCVVEAAAAQPAADAAASEAERSPAPSAVFTPTSPPAPAGELSPETKAVIDVMGGGEVVHA